MTKLFLDYVHHNPGQAPVRTRFTDPAVLRSCGINAQVFNNLNLLATFSELQAGLFPSGDEETQWYDALCNKVAEQNQRARAQGLSVFYQMDPLIFPKRLVDSFLRWFEATEPSLALDMDRAMSLYGYMLDELCGRFPEVDGFIIRVGETYVFDSPYHVGGAPIRWQEGDTERSFEKHCYVTLIQFLREKICREHGRVLIFRSWDCFADRMHADRGYYLDVVDQIEPHERLFFSVKHTTRDFWRYMEFNPCIGHGQHRQLIEIQSQREYEGKGAFANYAAGGVLRGFGEMQEPRGIASIYSNPQIAGLFTWSRGGGWYGPYLQDEFWCNLNTRLVAAFVRDPVESEAELFDRVCREELGMADLADRQVFRQICLLSEDAILKSIYCRHYDEVFRGRRLPTNLWFRDDRLGGLDHLRPVFEYLSQTGSLPGALDEKGQAVELWRQMCGLWSELSETNQRQFDYVRVSLEYGLRLFEWLYYGWLLMAEAFLDETRNTCPNPRIAELLSRYDASYTRYQEIMNEPQCASLFQPVFWSWPGSEPAAGLLHSIERIRAKLD